jgi:hypothetical protein
MKRLFFGVLALVLAGQSVAAQGNVSTLGFGYPPGQLSSRAEGAAGAFGEVDAQSGINPAALSTWGPLGIHFQYDPEFRTVKAFDTTENTTTSRFPVFSAGIPIGHFVVGINASTLLDQTWLVNINTYLPPETNDAYGTTATTTYRSTGGITDLQFGLAWNATPWLAVGAAFHAFTGEQQVLQEVTVTDTVNNRYQPSSYLQTNSYGGEGFSVGFELKPRPFLTLAGSYRGGGSMLIKSGDSTNLAHDPLPARAGGSIMFSGVPGVLIAGRVDWEGWSALNALSTPNPDLVARDGTGWSIGTDIQGPTVAGRVVTLRVGGGRRPLPYMFDGVSIMETDIGGGLGIPFGRGRATLDLSLNHDWRTEVAGVSESAYILSLGLTIRP